MWNFSQGLISADTSSHRFWEGVDPKLFCNSISESVHEITNNFMVSCTTFMHKLYFTVCNFNRLVSTQKWKIERTKTVYKSIHFWNGNESENPFKFWCQISHKKKERKKENSKKSLLFDKFLDRLQKQTNNTFELKKKLKLLENHTKTNLFFSFFFL